MTRRSKRTASRSKPIKGAGPRASQAKRSDAPKAVRNPRILNLIKKARTSAQGDPLIDWLKPFMVQRKYRKDDVVFQRGDVANELFWIESGKFLVGGTLIEIQAGRFFGELGIFAQGNQRTQTVKCTEDGNVRAIAYEKLLELFLDPKFSYSAFGFLLGAIARQTRLVIELQRSYGLIRQQANQLQAQSRELAKFNQQLEQRVADQVDQIERWADYGASCLHRWLT